MTDVLDPGIDAAARIDAGVQPESDEATAPPELSRRRTVGGVAGIAVLAGVWAVAGSLWLFPLLTDNCDEGAYLSQSAALRAGEILPPAPAAFTNAYLPWFSAPIDGSFVYKYTPVHASMIAAAHTLFTSDRALLVLVALANIVLLAFVARELGASRGAAVLACLVFALSPLWIIQSITFLPYAATLAMLQGFLLLVLKGFRNRSVTQLLGAGIVGGMAVFARPYDSVLFVGIVLAWQLWRLRRERVLRLVGWVALGVVPAAILFLAYNYVATGSVLRLPFHVTGSSDTLGFGDRSVFAEDKGVDYTVGKAISALTNNMKLVITWTFGGFVTLALAALGFSNSRDLKGRSLLALILVVWPIGFFFFWGSYVSALIYHLASFLGPYYYFPMLVALSIGAGVGIARLARGRAWLGALVVVALACLTLFTLVPAIDTNQDRTAQRHVVDDVVAQLDDAGPSLLFVPGVFDQYLQNPFSFFRNAPYYDGHLVYALDGGNRDFDIAEQYPGRTPYTLNVPTGYGGDRPAALIKAFTQKLRNVTGSSVTVTARVSPTLMDEKASLNVIVGSTPVRLPFHRDGTRGGAVSFVVTRANGLLTLTDTADPTRVTVTNATDHALQVGVRAETAVGPLVVYGKVVPMRTTRAGFELLLPGTVSNDLLGVFDQATIDVRVAP